MDAYASFAFEVPPGLRCDGVQDMGKTRLLQFTEMDENSPSYGTSFYIHPAELIEAGLAATREEARQNFAKAKARKQADPTPEVGCS